VDEDGKAGTIQKSRAQENRVGHPVNEVYPRGAREELSARPVSKIRVVGRDEWAIKKGHRHFATVRVDWERAEMIDILEYRDPQKLIEYFKNQGTEWGEGMEVFCSDLWKGFINTAHAAFSHAPRVVDRFHFFSDLNKAVDRPRKTLRRQFKDQEAFKRLKWA
jgi:transposase